MFAARDVYTHSMPEVVPIVVSVMVDAPLRGVWDALADLPSHPRWMRDAVTIQFPAGRLSGEGTVMVVDTRIGPFRLLDRLEITEWDEQRSIQVLHRGLVRGTGRFELAPMAGGVRVTWREDLRFPWWLGGSLTALAARPVLSRIWRGNLGRFRAMVEGQVSDR